MTGLLSFLLLQQLSNAQERVVVGFAIAEKAADDDATVAAEKALREDLAAAVKLLEEKNYSEFFVRYMPVDQFRAIRNRKDFYDIIGKAPKQDIDAFIKEMTLFKDAKVKFGPNNLTATLTVELKAEEAKPITLKAFPALKVVPEGYGDNLKVAITKAMADLGGPDPELEKSPDYVRFGKSFLPLSEVAHWEQYGWDRFKINGDQKISFTDNFNENRVRFQTHISQVPWTDLKALETLEPKLENDGRRAIYTLPHPKSKLPEPKEARKIIFELIDGHWRLADSSAEMKKAIESELNNKPRSSANTRTMPMEKLGTTWRFTPQSFR